MKFTLEFLAVFIATLVCDVAWAKYMMHAADKNAMRSALWSTAIVVLGGVSFFAYMDNRSMLVAAMLGAFVGTYWTVKRG